MIATLPPEFDVNVYLARNPDLLPVLKGLAVGSVGHSAANRKNLSFG